MLECFRNKNIANIAVFLPNLSLIHIRLRYHYRYQWSRQPCNIRLLELPFSLGGRIHNIVPEQSAR